MPPSQPDRPNPYAPDHSPRPRQPDSEPDWVRLADYAEPATVSTRVSKLAIVSLVVALTCVLSPLAVLLALVSFVRIQYSAGRLQGRALAVIALVIGLFFTSLISFAIVGGIGVWNKASALANIPAAISERRFADADDFLLPAVAASVSEAQWNDFADRVAAKLGQHRPDASSNIDEYVKSTELVQGFTKRLAGATPKSQGALFPIWIPAPFEKATPSFAVLVPDAEDFLYDLVLGSARDVKGSASNFVFVTPDGATIWLLPPPEALSAPSQLPAPAATPTETPGLSEPTTPPEPADPQADPQAPAAA